VSHEPEQFLIIKGIVGERMNELIVPDERLDTDFEQNCVKYMSILNKEDNLDNIINKYIQITESNDLLCISNLNFLRCANIYLRGKLPIVS